jgi:hypothetical protein
LTGILLAIIIAAGFLKREIPAMTHLSFAANGAQHFALAFPFTTAYFFKLRFT